MACGPANSMHGGPSGSERASSRPTSDFRPRSAHVLDRRYSAYSWTLGHHDRAFIASKREDCETAVRAHFVDRREAYDCRDSSGRPVAASGHGRVLALGARPRARAPRCGSRPGRVTPPGADHDLEAKAISISTSTRAPASTTHALRPSAGCRGERQREAVVVATG
jgi:hypothetical protein